MKRIFASILAGLLLTGCSCSKQESYVNDISETTATATELITEVTTTATEQTTTTESETTTTKSTAEQTTTTIIFTTESETTAKATECGDLKTLGTFKGTYYVEKAPCKGGSGRTLKSCSIKSDSYKGSVASRYIYEHYGYNVNGKTMVYLEIKEFPKMNGWYSVDDCNGDEKIVDLYFATTCECPYKARGVVTVTMYIA